MKYYTRERFTQKQVAVQAQAIARSKAVFQQAEKNQHEIYQLAQQRAQQNYVLANDLDRLRSVIRLRDAPLHQSTAPHSADSRPANAAADPIGSVLEQCASRYAGVARDAGELSDQIVGLQAHVHLLHQAWTGGT